MSYILDALKRADAERERGAVPSVHARQTTTGAAFLATGRRPNAWLLTSAGLLVALFGAAGLWRWLVPVSTTGPAGAGPAAVQARPLPAEPQRPAQPVVQAPPERAAVLEVPPLAEPKTPLPKQPSPTTASKTAAADRPAPVRPQSQSQSQTQAQAQTPATTPTQATGRLVVPAPAASATPAPPSAAAVAPTPPAFIPLLGDLPEDVRRQIPALVISGSVYSQNPGQRMLLVNNQVLTEGSQAASELTLEHIQPKTAVFVFRGTRFRLAH